MNKLADRRSQSIRNVSEFGVVSLQRILFWKDFAINRAARLSVYNSDLSSKRINSSTLGFVNIYYFYPSLKLWTNANSVLAHILYTVYYTQYGLCFHEIKITPIYFLILYIYIYVLTSCNRGSMHLRLCRKKSSES